MIQRDAGTTIDERPKRRRDAVAVRLGQTALLLALSPFAILVYAFIAGQWQLIGLHTFISVPATGIGVAALSLALRRNSPAWAAITVGICWFTAMFCLVSLLVHTIS